jgi:hypothetical protein
MGADNSVRLLEPRSVRCRGSVFEPMNGTGIEFEGELSLLSDLFSAPFADALDLAIERDVRRITFRLNRNFSIRPNRRRRHRPDCLRCAMGPSIDGVGRAQRDHRDRQNRPLDEPPICADFGHAQP